MSLLGSTPTMRMPPSLLPVSRVSWSHATSACTDSGWPGNLEGASGGTS